MATRDLTGKYRRLRLGFYKNQPQNNFTIDEGAQPGWTFIKESVESEFTNIEELIEKLHEAHKNRLMVRFGDEADSTLDREIDRLTESIGKKFGHTRNLLIQIGQSGTDNKDEEAVCKNIQRSLATKLQSLSLEFRKSQKQYMTRLKTQKAGKSSAFWNEEEEDDLENGPRNAGIKLSEGELLILQENQENLKERDKEIQKIASSINELAAIFKELAVLVVEQGTLLDRIDYNMDQVVERTEKGVKALEETVTIQKQARPQKCIIILVIINFILLVIFTFKHS